MFAGIVDSYLPDLVLQGVQENNFRASLSTDLKLALQHSVVDDPVSEAVCIIANTDKWTCEVVSVKKNRKQGASDHVHVQQVEVSNLVFSMLSSLSGLCDIKMSAEFCLMHLEDKLKEIYLKSKVITERMRDRRKLLTRDDLTKMLSVDDNDVPLLLAVASTHSPQSMPLVS
ncbi:folliculin-interacting protein 1-like [Oculina patagonica]